MGETGGKPESGRRRVADGVSACNRHCGGDNPATHAALDCFVAGLLAMTDGRR